MDRQVLGASGPLGRVWDRDKVDGRNEAGLEWAELCPVVKFRSVCLSGILLLGKDREFVGDLRPRAPQYVPRLVFLG